MALQPLFIRGWKQLSAYSYRSILYSFQNRAFLIRMTYGCLLKGVCPKLSVYENISEYDVEMDF